MHLWGMSITMDIRNKYDINFECFVTFSLSDGILNCKCDSVTNIPGTNNGNVTLMINVQLGDGANDFGDESINF